ncbi:unnamed protein product, partial [Iphiclides podalirius]
MQLSGDLGIPFLGYSGYFTRGQPLGRPAGAPGPHILQPETSVSTARYRLILTAPPPPLRRPSCAKTDPTVPPGYRMGDFGFVCNLPPTPARETYEPPFPNRARPPERAQSRKVGFVGRRRYSILFLGASRRYVRRDLLVINEITAWGDASAERCGSLACLRKFYRYPSINVVLSLTRKVPDWGVTVQNQCLCVT